MFYKLLHQLLSPSFPLFSIRGFPTVAACLDEDEVTVHAVGLLTLNTIHFLCVTNNFY